ncbi:MAG TPA: glycosyltransferase family 39 protein [Gemmatimonadaceae bacterium]|nr:glycosyltransferase family 39 protein [Gemmatimonadaceae bacterium]
MTDVSEGRWIRRLELGILAVGIGARAVRFLEQRPLWIDEVLIALNVLPNGPPDFLQPLELSQISPVGFLIGEWLVTRAAGAGEQALRFLPFVASIAALIAFNRLARRTLEPATALLATALAALSPLLIYYAGEIKSYTFDWLGAVLLMHATLSLAEDRNPRAWMRWSGIAGFGALMSTAAPFFVAGCALALLAVPAIRAPRTLIRLVVATAPAALLFAVQYFTTYSSDFTRVAMESYWKGQFLDAQLPHALAQAAQLARTFVVDVVFGDRVAESMPRKSMTIVVLLSAIGAVVLTRRSPQVAAIVLAPAVLAVTAALMHRWPLTSRLLLFLVPALAMALASGLAALTQLLPSRARGVAFAALSSLVLVGAAVGVRWEWNENNLVIALPDALRSVRQNSDANATVYFSSDLVPACTYYLGWHPDRVEMGGGERKGGRAADLGPGAGVVTTNCAVHGATTITGTWPLFVRRSPGAPRETPVPIQSEWLEAEGGRILAGTGNELWLLLGHSRQLHESLPAWLEAHGLRQTSRQQRRTLLVLQYLKGPS